MSRTKSGARAKPRARAVEKGATGLTSPLARRVLHEWADPTAFDELARALSTAEQDEHVGPSEVDAALRALVEWGASTHAADPDVLWTTHMRSPLRVALHLTNHAALDAKRYPALFDLLWHHAGATAAARRALAHDVAIPPDLLARVTRDRNPKTRIVLAPEAEFEGFGPRLILNRSSMPNAL